MDPQQDTLARSYTDSISSYLYNRLQEESDNNTPHSTNFYNSDLRSQSINSNMSYMNQTPIITIRSIADPEPNMLRRGSNGGSSYYGSILDTDSESFYKTDDAATPLPKLQMLVISIILLSEPLTSTILFPFIYFMLKDFHLSDDEKEIGTYAGWITSIFFIAQFCTALMWGKVSDRYGRRPVLLTGLVGNTLSTCLFGLSKNLWWAIGARAICGIMNGNGGVARSMVSEITDNTNKAKAFSIFGFCWGAGMIAGPALGGFLNRPALQYPNIFGNCQFLIEYPYFLPCFISALGSMIGFIVGFFYLEESNPSVIASKQWDADNRENNEHAALLKGSNETVTKRVIPKSGSMRLITKASYSVIIAYSVFSFHAMVFEEVLPLYFTAPVYAGGLGVTSADFAKALSFFGIAQLVLQFDTYPRLTKRFSTLTLCRVAFLAFIPIYILMPELSVFREWANGGSASWTFRMGYVFVLFFRYFGNCLAFTGLGIMVSTSAAPEVLGTVNGLCQSCLALVRAMGPTFGGTLWSMSIKDGTKYPFDRHLVYYLIAAMSLFSFIQSFSIPKSVALGGRSKGQGNH